jgi:hypothetical protein
LVLNVQKEQERSSADEELREESIEESSERKRFDVRLLRVAIRLRINENNNKQQLNRWRKSNDYIILFRLHDIQTLYFYVLSQI